MLREPGCYRIKSHVPQQLEVVAVVCDQWRMIPSLRNVPDAVVPSVEPSAIGSIEELHARGEIAFRGFQEKVVMIVHQTIRVTHP